MIAPEFTVSCATTMRPLDVRVDVEEALKWAAPYRAAVTRYLLLNLPAGERLNVTDSYPGTGIYIARVPA